MISKNEGSFAKETLKIGSPILMAAQYEQQKKPYVKSVYASVSASQMPHSQISYDRSI